MKGAYESTELWRHPIVCCGLMVASFFRAAFRMTEDDSNDDNKQSKSIPDRKGIFNHYFEADHPFVFIIWDYYSGMILLMGKVVQPDIIVRKVE